MLFVFICVLLANHCATFCCFFFEELVHLFQLRLSSHVTFHLQKQHESNQTAIRKAKKFTFQTKCRTCCWSIIRMYWSTGNWQAGIHWRRNSLRLTGCDCGLHVSNLKCGFLGDEAMEKIQWKNMLAVWTVLIHSSQVRDLIRCRNFVLVLGT